MAERNVPINSRILLIGDGATPTEGFDPVACLTDNSFQITNNDISTDTKCGTIHEPGTQNATVNFAGTVLLDPTGKVSASALFDLAKSKEFFNFQYGPADPVDGDLIRSGRGYITSYEESDPVNAQATFTGTIQLDANGISQTTFEA